MNGEDMCCKNAKVACTLSTNVQTSGALLMEKVMFPPRLFPRGYQIWDAFQFALDMIGEGTEHMLFIAKAPTIFLRYLSDRGQDSEISQDPFSLLEGRMGYSTHIGKGEMANGSTDSRWPEG